MGTTSRYRTPRGIPNVRGELGCATAIDKRRDQKDVAVYVDPFERATAPGAGARGTDFLLEKPSADVGVAIHSKTITADIHHLMPGIISVQDSGRVSVVDRVLVRHGVRLLPLPRANIRWVLRAAPCKNLGGIF